MGRPFMDTDLQNSTYATGKAVSLWIVRETIKNSFEQPAATDLVRVTADLNAAQLPTLLEDMQRRGDTFSKTAPVTGKKPHGTLSVTHYVKPDDTDAATATDNYPEGSTLIEAVFGASRVVNTGTAVNITAVDSTSSRTLTKFTLAAGTFTVGDGLALRTHASNAATSGPANGEVRRLAISHGANVYTVYPGFSKLPQAGATKDQIQGGVTYYLTTDLENTYSILLLDNKFTWQLTGCAVEDVVLSIDGKGILSMTHNIGFRKRMLTGEEMVLGDGSSDAFNGTVTTIKVADASVFSVGSLINIYYSASPFTSTSTETKATVTAINLTTNVLTVTRGSGAVTATELTADSTANDSAGPYDTTTKNILRVRIDNKENVDITLTAGAATAAATIRDDINTFLKNNQFYGYQTMGRRNVDWTAVASVVGGAVRLTSPYWGKMSRLQVIDTGLASSAHDRIFTAAFDIQANAAWVRPWTPAATETGKPVQSWVGWFNMDGWNFGVTKFDLTIKNPVVWLEDEKANDFYPTGWIVSGTRTVEAAIETYMRGKDGALFPDADTDTVHAGVVQCGIRQGNSMTVLLPVFRLFEVTPTGDEPRSVSAKLIFYAPTSTDYETEVGLSIN